MSLFVIHTSANILCTFLSSRGYFPKGGGEIQVRTVPVKQLKAVDMTDRGDLVKIQGRAFVAGVLPIKV